jgi:hypothetical protein
MKAFSALGAVAFALILAQPASADTIFSDAFNRAISDTVGNLWSETESASSSVSIVHVTGAANDNQLKLQGSLGNNTALDAAVAQLGGISTTGFQNLTLSFDFLGLNTDSGNTLTAQWRLNGSSTWTTIQSFALSDLTFPLNSSGSLLLGASASGTSIDIRLFTNAANGASGASDGAYIDNVVLSGTAVAAVPGPMVGAGLPGLIFAAGGFCAWRSRKRKAALGLI